ncbi:uncharacterized protein LOC106013021 [Aplysia californica]|uniref:Uncharacterized protein LOC106013021 n=1 Tax=Aplysia californica TaxID=6500 RepID=A0ABM1A8Y0_APLCA|nr:uncharacterized protein LOC106013021 [Aplysia californica]
MLPVCLSVLLMAVAAYGSSPMEQYEQLTSVQHKLLAADDRLIHLSQRNCQAGSGSAELCPMNRETPLYDVLSCVLSPLKGKDAPSQIVEIEFEYPFVTVPNAAVFTTGLSWIVGGGYDVNILEVTSAGLRVEVAATKIFAPGMVDFNFIACDKEIEFPHSYLDNEHNM